MANRHHSARRVKLLRTYDVRQAAKATGATPGTVRHWHKNGLEAVVGHWPLIFRGVDIIAFFRKRSAARKQRCGPGRIFCLRCKAPKTPALGMVDYRAETPKRGILTGLCPECGGLIYRRTSPANLQAAAGDLEVSIPSAESRLSGTGEPYSNDNSGRKHYPVAKYCPENVKMKRAYAFFLETAEGKQPLPLTQR